VNNSPANISRALFVGSAVAAAAVPRIAKAQTLQMANAAIHGVPLVNIAGTATWVKANPAKSAEILEKYAKYDPAILAKMTRTDFAETLTPQMIQPTLDWAYKVKFIERPVAATEMIAIL
jgi:hypothetical protein